MTDLITITWKRGDISTSAPINKNILDCLCEMAVTEIVIRFTGQVVHDRLVLYRVELEMDNGWYDCTEVYVQELYYQAFCPECIELRLG